MVGSVQRKKTQESAQRRQAMLDREQQRWLPLLIAHEKPEKIILFGSYNTGQIDAWSDLDRTRQVLELLKPQVGVDVLVYTPEEFDQLCRERAFFRQDLLAKGTVVYERVR